MYVETFSVNSSKWCSQLSLTIFNKSLSESHFEIMSPRNAATGHWMFTAITKGSLVHVFIKTFQRPGEVKLKGKTMAKSEK